MPKTSFANPFLKMNHIDLAYAMQRLVGLGATTSAQVSTLATERQTEIELLEAKVAALKAAVDLVSPAPTKRPYVRRAVKAAPVVKRGPGRPRGSKNKRPRVKVAKVAKVAKAVKAVKARKVAKPAKRTVTVSPKVLAARKVQGRYMGLRRQLTPQLQTQATKIAQADGVVAALKFVEANQPKASASAN